MMATSGRPGPVVIALPEDMILSKGASKFTVWPNKFFKFGPKARLLASRAGTMGYGLCAAIAAKWPSLTAPWSVSRAMAIFR